MGVNLYAHIISFEENSTKNSIYTAYFHNELT